MYIYIQYIYSNIEQLLYYAYSLKRLSVHIIQHHIPFYIHKISDIGLYKYFQKKKKNGKWINYDICVLWMFINEKKIDV